MIKKFFILLVLVALAYGTYRVVIYFAGPVTDIKKQGNDSSVPEDESSRLPPLTLPGDNGTSVSYPV